MSEHGEHALTEVPPGRPTDHGARAHPTPTGSEALDREHAVTPDRSVMTDRPPGLGGQSATIGLPERLVPVALSTLVEGLGQAYNRQPAKAAAMVVTGLGLSTASGLNTWLARRVFGAKDVTIGAERIHPWLLAAWVATYGYALWDAWAGASAGPAAASGSGGAASGHPTSAVPGGA